MVLNIVFERLMPKVDTDVGSVTKADRRIDRDIDTYVLENVTYKRRIGSTILVHQRRTDKWVGYKPRDVPFLV